MGRNTPAVPIAPALQRLSAIGLRGYLRRHETRLAKVAAVGSVATLLLVHWAAVSASAGVPGPVHHLAYPPILLAAYLFGLRGALLVTVVPVFVSGPFPVLLSADPATWAGDPSTVLRALMFLAIAVVTGILFEHLRAALDGWRTTAIRVAQREREGMVALARGAEAKDTDTGDHILRVQVVSERVAIATGMGPDEAAALGWAAMLHDVGKLRVPDHVLVKPGPLTPEEQAIVRRHTVWGERILAEGEGYETARRVARWHHENFDGTGYPDGLKGDRIPLEARIVRIADSFDAITHGRRYQLAKDPVWAVAELERCAGRQFDPELVRVFLDLLSGDPGFARQVTVVEPPEPGEPTRADWR
ncbi:hypothetical protein BH23CHL8_BH23CHL8_26310 [soil metagenome]